MLIPFELTYILYEEGDVLGFILSLITLIPLFAIVIILSFTVYFFNVKEMLIISSGIIISELLNLLLKNVINQKRPSNSPMSGKGFPSDHSQISFYIAIILTLIILFGIEPEGYKKWEYLWQYKIVLPIILFTLAFVISYSRIYLNFHTAIQVIAGGLIGVSFGLLWWILWKTLFLYYRNGKFVQLFNTMPISLNSRSTYYRDL